eukprot:9734849-Alexandrium_andersonii.AAC.1
MLNALVAEREAIRRSRSNDTAATTATQVLGPTLESSVQEREAQRAARRAGQAALASPRLAGEQHVQQLASLCHAHAVFLPDGVRVSRAGLVAICGYLGPGKAANTLLRQRGAAQHNTDAGYSLHAVVHVA